MFVGLAFTVAQAEPPSGATPSPSPVPRWLVDGTARAYVFTRQNASASKQGGANTAVNQASFNTGVGPHVQYRFDPHWTLGATYWYANPLNGCEAQTSHLTPPCAVVAPKGTVPNGSELDFDDALPGYRLSALNEAYLSYHNHSTSVTAGDQLLQTPWANAADTRIMPEAYQAVDARIDGNRHWTFEVADSWKLLDRTQSSFAPTTLLTQVSTPYSQGYGGLASNIDNPGGASIASPGFTYGRIGYTAADLAVNLYQYEVYDITAMTWLDARYALGNTPLKPFVMLQGGLENGIGRQIVGKIDSSLAGVLFGIHLDRHVVAEIGYDEVPARTVSLVLPAGFTCSPSTHTISAKNISTSLAYLLPSGGTPDCNTTGGRTVLSYGGWASPYTDGYSADPLFTSTLTTSMTNRRSPGQSCKIMFIGTSDDHRLIAYISYGGYDFNQPYMAAPTTEVNLDFTYSLTRPAGTPSRYTGVKLRYRYAERQQPLGNAAVPLFKYNRFQIEDDF